MTASDRTHPLSWGDTFFLYLERDGQPINIASCCEFQGKINRKACARFVESKLHLIPRYRQRAVFPSFNLSLPQWETDPDFDIDNHVHEVVLNEGTDGDLKTETAKVISSTLDRTHPLWDITLVRGLRNNRTGVIFRIHHAMADGVSGVGIMNALLDASPDAKKPAAPPKERPERLRPADSLAILLDEMLRSYQSFMKGALTAQTEVLNIAREVIASATHGHAEDLVHLVPELVTPSDRLPFNRICYGPQRIAWGEIPMDQIKAIRDACGGTMNDVVLAVVTSTVGRYSEHHGVALRGRHLRLVIPVNVRGDGDISELGNRITFLPVNVPLDVSEPRELLSRIHERVSFLRGVGVPELVGIFGMMVSKIPLPIQAQLVPVLTQLPLSLANMICTNVPGPQMPLYLLGHKLLRCYPYVPIGGELGINVAILSYNGTAYVGFGGDAQAVPDIKLFETLLKETFAELRSASAKAPAFDTSTSAVNSDAKPVRRHVQMRTIPTAEATPKLRKQKPRTIKAKAKPAIRHKAAKARRAATRFPPAIKPAAEARPPVEVLAATGD
jgi:WS/DGAT/MGAT family acyltransferase